MVKVDLVDQQKCLVDDIQECVILIFEVCNFQDLIGQCISKVMVMMKFIEQYINVMMDIWGGVDVIKVYVLVQVDGCSEDEKFFNGLKFVGDVGYVFQDDIDVLFD